MPNSKPLYLEFPYRDHLTLTTIRTGQGGWPEVLKWLRGFHTANTSQMREKGYTIWIILHFTSFMGGSYLTYVSERDLKGCVTFSLHYGNPERFGLLAFLFPLSMICIAVIPGLFKWLIGMWYVLRRSNINYSTELCMSLLQEGGSIWRNERYSMGIC